MRKTWSSFSCLLALASVTCTEISSNYPKVNNAFNHFLNRDVLPRTNSDFNLVKAIHILWSRCGNVKPNSSSSFSPNHFPLFVGDSKTAEKIPPIKVSKHLPKVFQTNLNFFPKKCPIVDSSSVKEEIFKETKRKQNVEENNDNLEMPPKKLCTFPAVPGVNSFDIGQFVSGKELDDLQLADFLTKLWIPPKDYSFPVKEEFNKSRKFLSSITGRDRKLQMKF